MDEISLYPSQFYSLAQQKVLVIIPAITGFLSIVGSIIILRIIKRDWQEKSRFSYYRFLTAMALVDILSSASHAIGAILNPAGVVWGASGTFFSCSLHGYLILLGSAVPLYNMFLSIYYILVIRFQKSQAFVAKYAEPYMHVIALGTPLIVGILTWSAESFNPLFYAAGTCFINAYPPLCITQDDVECTRGGNKDGGGSNHLMLNYMTHFVIYGMAIVIMIGCWAVVVRHEAEGRDGRDVDLQASRTRQTKLQAILYISAYFATVLPAVIQEVYAVEIGGDDVGTHFALAAMVKLFLPLQGFFNCIVFVRPQYAVMRLQERSRSIRTGNDCSTSFWSKVNQIIIKRSPTPEEAYAPELTVRSNSPDDGGSKHRSDKSFQILSVESNFNLSDHVMRQEMPIPTNPCATNGHKAATLRNEAKIDSVDENYVQSEVRELDASLFEDSDEELAALRRIFFSY